MNRAISAIAAAALCAGGCGASGYTIVDRSSLVISDNSRASVKSIIPAAAANAAVAEHLALAEEIFQKQLNLLKERRNKVRARRRELNFASFGVMAATALGAGAAAISSTGNTRPGDALLGAGFTALAGLGLGTVLQIAALMQEDYGSVDDKIRHLQHLYDGLLDQVRLLMNRPTDSNPANSGEAQIGAAIESFINAALQINVKG